MPYFKNDNINLLFIHIPKTGGSSLEEYFCNKYNIKLNEKSLFSTYSYEYKIKNNIMSNLQHLTYNNIMNNKILYNIDLKNINIITIVRNPYDRIISALFYLEYININSLKEEVYNKIKTFINDINNKSIYPCMIPQYLFITNENKELIKDIKILKTETLKDDMHKLEYNDFGLKININNNKKKSYYSYLNNDSINLINSYYDYDFKILNYTKIYNEI